MTFPLALSVGVTGHRTLDPGQLPRITAQVHQILEAIRQYSLDISRDHAELFEAIPLLRVVSCLSEGADRLVAQEGLALEFKLNGVLPFPCSSTVHAHGLSPAAQQTSRAELQNLLAQAEGVLELDPDYVGEEDAETQQAKTQRQYAYAEAGLRMLDHSDLLIAIWHGEPQLMPASTMSTIEHALEQNMLVVWVHARDDVPPVLYRKHFDGRSNFQPLLSFSSEECPLWDSFRQRFAPTKEIKQKLLQLKEGSKGCALSPSLHKPFWYSWWKQFFSRLAPVNPLLPDFSTLPRVFHNDYNVFSNLAIFYGNLHRSFFLLTCILGTIAVTVAVLGMNLPPFGWHGFNQKYAKIALGCVEFSLICYLWRVHIASGREEWQQKFTDYRLVAEYLRHTYFLRGFGMIVSDLRSLPYYSEKSADWVRWYIRALIRQAGIPNVSLADKETVQNQKGLLACAWLMEQHEYHKENARRSKLAKDRLHNLSETLFWLTLVCVMAHLVLKIAHLPIVPGGIITTLAVMTILLPLWAMSAHALGQYAEFRRLHDRSTAMQEKLELLCQQMQAQHTPSGIARVVNEATSLMLRESVEWRVQYNMPSVSKA